MLVEFTLAENNRRVALSTEHIVSVSWVKVLSSGPAGPTHKERTRITPSVGDSVVVNETFDQVVAQLNGESSHGVSVSQTLVPQSNDVVVVETSSEEEPEPEKPVRGRPRKTNVS